jgi:hypothetical protein
MIVSQVIEEIQKQDKDLRFFWNVSARTETRGGHTQYKRTKNNQISILFFKIYIFMP